jgi:hypothetical protein
MVAVVWGRVGVSLCGVGAAPCYVQLAQQWLAGSAFGLINLEEFGGQPGCNAKTINF